MVRLNRTTTTEKNLPRIRRDSFLNYEGFDQLDGSHSWQAVSKDGYLLYEVRGLNKGLVSYFNYQLAKEMGLIPQTHPEKMNEILNKKIIHTFSLQIVNEFDKESKNYKEIKKEGQIRPIKYMATRYLQLQHKDKRGLFSGDGRSIWNGTVKHKGKVWDVSSRGTGVTQLSPGYVEAGGPIPTGGEKYGYGCGLAEIDELYSCAIQSEIFYRQGLNTERVLCIINLGNGVGIGVRAGENLLRPAHLFRYLKQEKHLPLKKSLEYFLNREEQNKNRQTPVGTKIKSSERFNLFGEKFGIDMGKFAAFLVENYVFAWLDWDGDNLLLDPGIIDYGNIRQFGSNHFRYRYDDVHRYSTNLNEQKAKAKLTVKVMSQMIHFINSGKKRPMSNFANSKMLDSFEKSYAEYETHFRLKKYGLSSDLKMLLKDKKNLAPIIKFKRVLNLLRWFELQTLDGKFQKIADGINLPAIFDVRDFFYRFKQFESNFFKYQSIPDFFITGWYKKSSKSKKTIYKKKWNDLRQMLVSKEMDWLWKNVRTNGHPVLTGNALVLMVSELIEHEKDNSIKDPEFIQGFINLISNNFGPGDNKPRLVKNKDLWNKMLKIADAYKHDI